jgi:hypothetical protein
MTKIEKKEPFKKTSYQAQMEQNNNNYSGP